MNARAAQSPKDDIRVFPLDFTFAGEKVLELGGGTDGTAKYRPNIDVRRGRDVDIIASFEHSLPIKSGVFDGVFSKFVLEHISLPKVPQFISEIYRILKPTGKAIVATMDLKAVATRLAGLDHWDENDIAVIFRGLDYPEDLHRSGFSPEYLDRLFKKAGFKARRISGIHLGLEAKEGYWPDMVIEAWKSPVDREGDDELKPHCAQGAAEEANVRHPEALYELPFREGDKLIELGGGDRPLVRPNLDVRPGSAVDIVADFEKPLPLDSAAYDGIYSSYVIEHLSWRTLKRFIAEVYRILKPDGIAVLLTANLLEQARTLVEKGHWEEGDIAMVFGGQDYPANTHRCGFSPEYAARLFFEQGFYEVKVIPLPWAATDMIIEARKSGARITTGLPMGLIPLQDNP